MTNKSNSSLKDALADIKMFRQEINQRLDELERQIEDAANVIQKENNKHLKAVEEICEDITKCLKTSSDTIKQLNTSKEADKLFMELKLAEKTMKNVDGKKLQLSSYDIKEFKLKTNDAILDRLKTEKSLGTLIQRTLKIKSPSVQIKYRQSSHQGDICVKTSKDKDSCWITGMTLLTPDLLIITDYKNDAVKMVDTSSQSVSYHLQLNDSPWGITTVTSTKLAVTHTYKQTIQFISISSNKLKKKDTMKVNGHCHGISCYQDKLFVTYRYPGKLQILEMNGTILTTTDDKIIFKDPDYVTCNKSSIYVSDRKMKSVTRLNWQGDVVGSYGCAGAPRGISPSNDGTVFVCGWDRNIIEEISEDCSTGKVVLQDVIDPFAVCWSDETKKLYFSCNCSTSDTNYDFIYMHKLS
ncbi:uncharacterized protein LOC132742554 [Ruditapes philippinarum]|uniref:uncharacterized protein LOC132742554 n=1 Tax=Ruditapes philippinarum TaxID=129788 RepID=UPI00295BF555|nr:uncharacterized protein LOC132742554 [Ruditapes philippinarum]